MRMAIYPLKSNAPLVVDADRVKFTQVSLQPFQTVRRRDEQIVKPACRIEHLELAFGRARDTLEFANEPVAE
jgi:hypothetical protein